MSRLSTGVSILDRQLDGGVPAGSLTALVAPAESQSELLCNRFAGAGPSVVVSTMRPADEVRDSLAADGVDPETTRVVATDPDELVDDPTGVVGEIPEGGYLVLDAATPLDRVDRDRQVAALNALKDAVEAVDAAGLLHCLGVGDSAGRTRTLARVDLVWRLNLLVTSLAIENRLIVSKFRGGRAMTEPIKLKLTDRVRVDTSRDIA